MVGIQLEVLRKWRRRFLRLLVVSLLVYLLSGFLAILTLCCVSREVSPDPRIGPKVLALALKVLYPTLLAITVTSLIGIVLTTILAWRKEKRDTVDGHS